MEKSLLDIRAFSEREDRPFEETRQHVAEWHSRYLFERRSNPTRTSANDKIGRARAVLCDTSRILESLEQVSGIHSFVLAVDPSDAHDQGFLGGSMLGREFWRDLRGGSDGGVKNFKAHCMRHGDARTSSLIIDPQLSQAVASSPPKRGPASSLKAEVYAKVRNALRSTSGARNAEMKWTNHDRLCAYGVRIVGWPPGIPHQNPSSLSSTQNKILLDSLVNGKLKFVKGHEGNHVENTDYSAYIVDDT